MLFERIRKIKIDDKQSTFMIMYTVFIRSDYKPLKYFLKWIDYQQDLAYIGRLELVAYIYIRHHSNKCIENNGSTE